MEGARAFQRMLRAKPKFKSLLRSALRMWPRMTVLNSIFVSCDLANSAHIDIFDSHYSFAIWLLPPGAMIVAHAYLAFPTYGLRVALDDRTIIAWPGFLIPHCTMEGTLQWRDGRPGPPPAMLSFFIGRATAFDQEEFVVN